MTNYYDVLGVPPEADAAEIRAAYRSLALQHHPDRGGDPAHMQELNAAYAVLGDPEKRANYDRSLRGAAGGEETSSRHAAERPDIPRPPQYAYRPQPRPLRQAADFDWLLTIVWFIMAFGNLTVMSKLRIGPDSILVAFFLAAVLPVPELFLIGWLFRSVKRLIARRGEPG